MIDTFSILDGGGGDLGGAGGGTHYSITDFLELLAVVVVTTGANADNCAQHGLVPNETARG